jgi:hypothetical protein
MIGVCGLLCFIEGYDFVRKDLSRETSSVWILLANAVKVFDWLAYRTAVE